MQVSETLAATGPAPESSFLFRKEPFARFVYHFMPGALSVPPHKETAVLLALHMCLMTGDQLGILLILGSVTVLICQSVLPVLTCARTKT